MAQAKFTTIWKFPLKLAERQVVSMPVGATLLHLGFDGTPVRPVMCLWAAVDADAPKIDHEIILVGTGQPLPHVGTFLGTVVDGQFVWHLFTGPGTAIQLEVAFHYMTKGAGQ